MVTRRNDVTKEQMEAAIESIAVTGKYTQACNILDISSQTWYNWRKDDERLAKRVAHARKRRWKNSDYVKRSLAEDLAMKTLREGVKTVTVEEKDVVNPLTGDVEVISSTKTVTTGAPLKLIERYLVPSNPEMELIQKLVDAGYLSMGQLEEIEDAINNVTTNISAMLNAEESQTTSPDIQQSELTKAATTAIRRILQEATAGVSTPVVSGSVESESVCEVSEDRDKLD